MPSYYGKALLMRHKTISSGKCAYCSKTFSGSKMGHHLQSCKEREMHIMPDTAGAPAKVNGSKKVAEHTRKASDVVLLLKVSARYMPEYWLFVDASARFCKLADIDSLLRRTWLECCGHLSHFIIDDEKYEFRPNPMFGSDKDMRIALDRVLQADMTFSYEYDYGSTTELVIKVVEMRPAKFKKKMPLLMVAARNDSISFKCTSCKKALATDVCSVCFWEDPDATFCKSCLNRHICGESMALPIVNSPRTGVCGYTG
jgi:hypothetical protein